MYHDARSERLLVATMQVPTSVLAKWNEDCLVIAMRRGTNGTFLRPDSASLLQTLSPAPKSPQTTNTNTPASFPEARPPRASYP